MAADDSGNDDAHPQESDDYRTRRSSSLEKALEYRFLADLSRELLRQRMSYDVMRGDVDHEGYDLAIEANGVIRHIQLKAMVAGGKRASVAINTRLARKPSGCVVWMRYDPSTFEVGPFAWFGGEPGEPLPYLGGPLAKHTKGNAQGVKTERPGHRIVRRREFEAFPDMAALAQALFGSSGNATILHQHLERKAGEQVHRLIRSLCPDRLMWDNSGDIALLVDGYELADRAGMGDPMSLYKARLEEAARAASWPGDLLELWTTLFLEHRRWHFSSPYRPDLETHRLLDRLCEQVQNHLVDAGLLSQNL